MMKADAVIVSAGKGLRFTEAKPKRAGTAPVAASGPGKKQFHLLGGKPILSHTLAKFETCPLVRSILLVAGQEDMDYCLREIVEKYNFKKVSQIVPGGKRRQDSVKNGIEALPRDAEIVAIHDGVRPFVTREMIEETLTTAARVGAVVLAIPMKDTIKVSNPDGTVLKTLDRETVWQIQTPQSFRVDVIKEAYRRAGEEGFVGTDDASLVERLGIKVHILPGSYTNIKITTLEDLFLANFFLKTDLLTKELETGGMKNK